MKKIYLWGLALTLLSMLLCPARSFGQSVRITGTVTDSSGAALLGVQVIDESNLSNGTVTDGSGRYSISVAPSASLLFTYVGYTDQSITVGNRRELNVTMEASDLQIDDVVVIGYGVQRRSDVTGAIASVNATDLANRSTSDAASALQGKAAGVQILNLGGAPGEGASIRVRGYSSNSGNTGPLLIVDGLKVDNIQYLDPNMIESMEVLKDAASAAIYGAEAGNGVVLITTKRGSEGTGRIFYSYQHTISSLGKTPEMMNAEQYIQYNKEAGLLTDAILQARDYNGTDTNWAEEVFGRGVTRRHTVGFEGANDRGSLYLSINNVSDNGIMRGDLDVYNRLSAQINAEYKIKPWLTVGTNASFERWASKTPSQRSEFASVLGSTVINDPLTPVYYNSVSEMPIFLQNAINDGRNVMKGENGLYYAVSKYIDNDSGSPFIQRDLASKNSSEGINTRGTFYANFTPIKGLVFTSRFGFRLGQGYSSSYSFPYFANAMAYNNTHQLNVNSNSNYYYQWENFANYSKRINRHDFSVMAGMSFIESRSFGVNGGVSGTNPLSGYADNFLYVNYATADATRTISSLPGQSASMAYFGRLSYTYDNRYMLQANFRADAFDSSKLPASNRWGYFPSVSAGWTISNEAFMKSFAQNIRMDHLKLRASWGRNGNINVLSGYQYNATIGVNGQVYQWGVGDPTVSYGSMPSGLVNPNLQWETSDQVDVGLDARFLNNRLTFSVDYYEKVTKDLLVSVTPPLETGIASVTKNAGEISNKGLEFVAGWQDRIGDFRYSVNGNFSTLKNKVTYLDPTVSRISGGSFTSSQVWTYFQMGYPLWYISGFDYIGVDPNTGDPRFRNVNGDKVKDANGNDTDVDIINDDDLTMIGSGIPDYTYGVTINVAYKNFDLTLFGMGQGGNEIFSCIHRTDRPLNNSLAMFYENRWTESNRNASLPRPGSSDEQKFWSSDANIFSGNFFKIKQIQLGYTVPSNITRRLFVENLRVYVSLDDFFTFSNYPGFDPEVASANNNNSLGLDKGAFPISKKVLFGVNISF